MPKAILLFLLFTFCFSCAVFAQEKVVLQTEDKWRLEASYRPSENEKYIILLHDLGKRKEEFSNFAKKLSDAGYGYLAVDLRGHGNSTNLNLQKNFAKTGEDNEFNQMPRDVSAAVSYLKAKGARENDIFLLGAGLGANIAAKSLPSHLRLAGVVLLTPSLKNRDVLSMAGLKNFKGPVFIGVSSTDRKQFMEASFIRNAAFLSSGEGKVTFMTAYNLKGSEMLDRYLSDEVLQWLKTPQLPEILPDAPLSAENAEESPSYIDSMTMRDVLKSLD